MVCSRQVNGYLVSEAIALHLEGMIADGLSLPEPGGVDVGQVELPLPA